MGKAAERAAARTRPIRFDQFKKQLAEIGIENLQEIELSKDVSIFIRLGNNIDVEDGDEFADRLDRCETSEDTAMVVLDYYDGASADEQWELYKAHGGTADQLAILFASATADQAQRLGKVQVRRK